MTGDATSDTIHEPDFDVKKYNFCRNSHIECLLDGGRITAPAFMISILNRRGRLPTSDLDTNEWRNKWLKLIPVAYARSTA
jgi:hypothetical protein